MKSFRRADLQSAVFGSFRLSSLWSLDASAQKASAEHAKLGLLQPPRYILGFPTKRRPLLGSRYNKEYSISGSFKAPDFWKLPYCIKTQTHGFTSTNIMGSLGEPAVS